MRRGRWGPTSLVCRLFLYSYQHFLTLIYFFVPASAKIFSLPTPSSILILFPNVLLVSCFQACMSMFFCFSSHSIPTDQQFYGFHKDASFWIPLYWPPWRGWPACSALILIFIKYLLRVKCLICGKKIIMWEFTYSLYYVTGTVLYTFYIVLTCFIFTAALRGLC